MTQKLNFTAAREDQELIGKIVARGIHLGQEFNVKMDHLTCAMDITAIHCNGTPLKLLQFLMSDNVDFSHDFLGIILHIDRNTGKLNRNFSPRFSV